MQRDSTPIPTDWNDIHDLWGNMKKFAAEHPRHVFIPADDPGHHYNPVRVPRLGWVAFLEGVGIGGDEQAKEWTITVSDLKRTLRKEDASVFLSSADRYAQLRGLRGG